VVFYNGKKIELSEVEGVKTRSQEIKQIAVTNTLIFRIQIAAVKSLTPETSAKFDTIKKTYPMYTFERGEGITVYTFGEYTNYDEAKEAKSKFETLGYKDSFIVSFKSGKQIPIELALKLLK
jgi:N-acetylmuramoyl-L-alanine amidase